MATAEQTIGHCERSRLSTLATASDGFILLDSSLRPIALNGAAAQILTFPSKLVERSKIEALVARQIKSLLAKHPPNGEPNFALEFVSGRRKYLCRAFAFNSSANGRNSQVAVLLERGSPHQFAVERAADRFKLTRRERQVVELLMQGLTTKEIAARINLSPNTIKAFLRVVMVRMGTSTRSGIIGKLLDPSL